MRSLIIILSLYLMSSGPAGVPAASDPVHVSMVELIATPEKFEGQFVTVLGFGTLQFEEFSLFMSKEDYVHRLNKSVWLSISEERAAQLRYMNQTYVLVAGTFTSKHHGHLGGSLGEIAVERMVPIPEVAERKSAFGCSR